jgi:hypothetical protein
MNKPTPQQLAILAEHPDSVLHFGGKRPVKKKSRPTVLHRNGHANIGKQAKYWSVGGDDWWKWEGDSKTDIIAYIPDPEYPQPPVESLYDHYAEEMLKPRPTRQDARDMLADAFESVDPDHNWAHIRSDEKADETACVKAILDAIAGEE